MICYTCVLTAKKPPVWWIHHNQRGLNQLRVGDFWGFPTQGLGLEGKSRAFWVCHGMWDDPKEMH